MIEKKVKWYAVQEEKPSNGMVVLVYKPAGKKNVSDLFDFAIYYSDWEGDGKEAFIDMNLQDGEDVRISYEPDFWADLEFPV